MMRLPPFRYVPAKSIETVLDVLSDHGPEAMVVAGGTDLFPNMKRKQQTPKTVIGLKSVSELHTYEKKGNKWMIGSMTSLAKIAADINLPNEFKALQKATIRIATPHLRNMGTIGGNICLDTRCNYYDQNYEWRKAIGFCMKKDGEICWVAPSSPRCWAVSSTDTAPALMALNAWVRLVSKQEERVIPLQELYADDGIEFLNKKPNELLSEVRVPLAPGWKSTYWKLRRRGSFDFPVLGVAAALKMKGKTVENARVVLGAISSHPVIAEECKKVLVGNPLTDEFIDKAAQKAWEPARPLDNTDFALTWRKTMVRKFVTGALKELRGEPISDLDWRFGRY